MKTTPLKTSDSVFRESLEVSKAHFQKIVEKTPAGICMTNEKGMFEYVNPSYCKLYGYGAEELVGRHFTLIVPEHLRAYLSRLHDQFFQGKAEVRGEWEVITKSGTPLSVLADAAHIIGKDNQPRKVTFVTDITDRKKAEEALARAKATLEDQVAKRTEDLVRANSELRKAHAHLTEAQYVGQMGSWEWDIRNNRITWSDEVHHIFGTDPDAFDATYPGLFINSARFFSPRIILTTGINRASETVGPCFRRNDIFFMISAGSPRLSFPRKRESTNEKLRL